MAFVFAYKRRYASFTVCDVDFDDQTVYLTPRLLFRKIIDIIPKRLDIVP